MTNQEIHDNLIELVPEFKRSSFYDPEEIESPYLFASFFGQYLLDLVKRYVQHPDARVLDTIRRSLEFTNRLFDTMDPEIVNIASMEILEYLEESPEYIALALPYLSDPAASALRTGSNETQL